MQPAESDELLSRLWQQFAQSEAREALELAVESLLTEADAHLLAAASSPTVRAHAAGQVSALRRLLTTISAAIRFRPTEASYSSTGQDEEPNDIPADDDTLI